MKEIRISQSITNTETRVTELYLNELGKHHMVTPEMETELARKSRNGDKAAQQKLITANLRFVVSVAKRYQNYGLPLADLISEGNLGLIRAAESFDETRGFKFISFAVFWIRQRILEAISQQSRTIRLPNHHVDLLAHISKTAQALEQQQERPATTAEIARQLEEPESRIRELLTGSHRTSSLDAPQPQTENFSLHEIIASAETTDHTLQQQSISQELAHLLEILTPQERHIVHSFYGIGLERGLTTPDIARQLGYSQQRIHQIKQAALLKLRQHPATEQLKT